MQSLHDSHDVSGKAVSTFSGIREGLRLIATQ